MNRQAFKQRMQNLKSYREQNPGKGYWDWKVQAYENAGETGDDSNGISGWFKNIANKVNSWFASKQSSSAVNKSVTPLAYSPYESAQNSIENRNKEYDASLKRSMKLYNATRKLSGLDSVEEDIPDPGFAFFLSPSDQKRWFEEHGYRTIDVDEDSKGYGLVNKAAQYYRNQGKSVPIYEYTADSDATITDSMVKAVANIRGMRSGFYKDSLDPIHLPHGGNHDATIYVDQNTGRLYARTWDVNDYGSVSSGTAGAASKYPWYERLGASMLDSYGEPFVQRTGYIPIDWEQLSAFNQDQLPEATRRIIKQAQQSVYDRINNNTSSYVEGGETGNNTPVISTTTYNNYGDITHNIAASFNNGTLNLGLPDVVVTPRDNLDLAGYVNNRMNNAARFGANIMDLTTPVGDVHQLYDVVNDTRSGDYLSAGIGLAALALPFSPMTVKQFRSLYRGITPKGRTKYNSKLMDQLLEKKIVDEDLYQQKKRNFYDRAIEDRNEVYDTWIENEDAFRRAVDFDKKYGTQYKKAYSDELKAYAKSPYSDGVTKIGVKSLGSANGKFYLEEPDWIFLNRDDIPMGAPQTGVVNHEMGHKIDSQAGVINRDGTIDKKLFNPTKFKSKEELLKQYSPDVVDRVQSYLLNDSEVKSHMNAFRTYLRRNKMLDPSGKENLKDFKKKLFDSGFDNLKILFNTYKKPRTFVRDFNAIPITKATTKTDKELV